MLYVMLGAALLLIMLLIFAVWRKGKSQAEEVLYYCKRINIRLHERIDQLQEELKLQQERIGKLESGVCADYEKAKKAAEAMNDFNDGISNILNFDPASYLKERREGGGKQ